MIKKTNTPSLSKGSKKVIKKNKSHFTKDIYLANFHFQKKHDKQKIVVKDVLVTINSEMTPNQIEETLSNPYYLLKALRSYYKLEKRVFHQDEVLDKYIPTKIDFVKRVGYSFAP